MTKPYAEVIGDPIGHSKSPLIHGFWIAELGLDAAYRAAHVSAAALPDYFESRRADPAWRGCNITLPHKQTALALVEDRGHGDVNQQCEHSSVSRNTSTIFKLR